MTSFRLTAPRGLAVAGLGAAPRGSTVAGLPAAPRGSTVAGLLTAPRGLAVTGLLTAALLVVGCRGSMTPATGMGVDRSPDTAGPSQQPPDFSTASGDDATRGGDRPGPSGPPESTADAQPLRVIAVESFLADITKNVAGDRAVVEALIPTDVDPHTFEATPGDVRRIADADVVVINGAGLEVAFELTIHAAASRVVVASEGLEGRHAAGAGDPSGAADAADPARRDPHFWLDPLQVVAYADNIAAGLTDADPAGAESYAANAATYQAALRRLDDEIRGAVAVIPVDQRKLVTDHEELGYYADRYGFRVIGAVVPSLSPEAQASARDLAALIDRIRTENVRAIFVERGANPQMAAQVASETGARVVADLYTHSLSAPDGPAPTYAAMLRYDTSIIVDALAGGP